MTTAKVTTATNRVDLFAREHLGGAADANIRNLISWNVDYFAARRTFWLGDGDTLNTSPPVAVPRYLLVVNGGWLTLDDDRLLIAQRR